MFKHTGIFKSSGRQHSSETEQLMQRLQAAMDVRVEWLQKTYDIILSDLGLLADIEKFVENGGVLNKGQLASKEALEKSVETMRTALLKSSFPDEINQYYNKLVELDASTASNGIANK